MFRRDVIQSPLTFLQVNSSRLKLVIYGVYPFNQFMHFTSTYFSAYVVYTGTDTASIFNAFLSIKTVRGAYSVRVPFNS